MKLKFQFIIAAFIALVVYAPIAHGQANLTFSGGGGTQLVTKLTRSVSYTITNTNCATATVTTPFFNLDETGNITPTGAYAAVTGNISFSVNSGTSVAITSEGSGFTGGDTTANDIALTGSGPTNLANGSTVVLSAGTVTTTTNIAVARPANGSYVTYITNGNGVRCSSNGVAIGPTAANVTVSGRVKTATGRGIRNVQITLTDSSGNTKTAISTTFGYYHFDDVAAGETVTLSVKARQFRFAQSTIVRTTNDSISDADFVSEQ